MKSICFYFQIHQPFRLKRYRFFNIGNDHYYFDDYSNEDIMQQIAARSYIPANRMLLDLVKQNLGRFKVSFSISGLPPAQIATHPREVIHAVRASRARAPAQSAPALYATFLQSS